MLLLQKLLEYVFAADDFLMFKSIMVKRNIELDLQVIDMVNRAQAARKQSLPQPQPEQAAANAASGREEYDEEKVLQEVMKRSMAEFQQEETAITDTEMDRMLESARLESIRLFEAMQAEEEQMARLLQATLALSQLTHKEGLHDGHPQTAVGKDEAKALGPAEVGEEPRELEKTADSKPELEPTQDPQPVEQPRSIWDACLSPPPVVGANDGTDGGGHGNISASAPGGGDGASGGGDGGSNDSGGGTRGAKCVTVGGMSGGGAASDRCSSHGDGSRGNEGGGNSEFTNTGTKVPGDHRQILDGPQCVAVESNSESAATAWLESAKRDAEKESKVRHFVPVPGCVACDVRASVCVCVCVCVVCVCCVCVLYCTAV